MSEQTPEPRTGRAWIRFDDKDAGEVSLPGYLNPIPSIVTAGDVFSIDATYAGEITAGGDSTRFVEVDEPTEKSPNDKLTKAKLAAKLNEGREGDAIDPADYSKDELVALADEYDRMHPEPTGSAADSTVDGTAGDSTEGNESA